MLIAQKTDRRTGVAEASVPASLGIQSAPRLPGCTPSQPRNRSNRRERDATPRVGGGCDRRCVGQRFLQRECIAGSLRHRRRFQSTPIPTAPMRKRGSAVPAGCDPPGIEASRAANEPNFHKSVVTLVQTVPSTLPWPSPTPPNRVDHRDPAGPLPP